MLLPIVFCGTPSFACPSLQALKDDPSFEILSVITQPDKPAGRGKKLTPPPVKELALTVGLPVHQPQNINNLLSQMPNAKCQVPDYLVVVAYGQILSKELLAWPKVASVNVHPSLLPRWRGASPIQNAILAGDLETGVTVQRMVEKLDCGPILAQERVAIDPRATRISLEEKLARLGAELLVRTLKNPLKETPQDETKATQCTKLTRTTGNVDPKKMTAEEIDRRVRALVPWPGVRLRMRGRRGGEDEMKLIETSLEPHPDALAVPCAKGTILYVSKLQPETKRVMSGSDWLRGMHVPSR